MVMPPQVSWLFFKARAKRPSRTILTPAWREPDPQERKMVRDAPSSRLAGDHFERNDVTTICETAP
jgi:hypothetical protein